MAREYDERYEVQNDAVKEHLRDLAADIDERLPEGWGFGLFLFSFGEGGSMFWISNAQRADAVNTLKEWIAKQEGTAAALPSGSLVLSEVVAERARQDAKWGGPEHDDTHGLRDWFFFINHQMANHSRGRQDGRAALVKIAALAIAGIESIDRKAVR